MKTTSLPPPHSLSFSPLKFFADVLLAHVVSQERLAFGSHMAQESGDEKKDSAHILFFVFSFTVHFFSCVLFIRVRVFLNKRIIERTFFSSQPCFAVFFWRHSRERVFSQKQHDLTRIKMQAF